MIYISDYGNLNSLVLNNQKKELRLQLCALRHQTVTVFVDCGGSCAQGFTGLLMEVLCDSVKLLTPALQRGKNQIHNNWDECRSAFNKNKQKCEFSTTVIKIRHITAVAYKDL